MTPERWQQIEALYQAALALPAEERDALLNEADEDVRREVESLLAEHEQDPEFLEEPLLGELAGASAMRERIGPYAVVRALGRGGMGDVYLAARDDLRQRVAIKVIRRGLDTEDILQRFRAERLILASLNHPNIARIFDGGATDDGLPYFVMEYVEGTPVTTYCDDKRLSIDDRLRLFRTICGAVHHAHQNLIVHRDIKPSNILVTADGTPKLLDFGIAKLLDPAQAGISVPVTRTELRLMTPEYASPEQVRGARVTTASDVYSLGVLLYELLTGHRPYQLPRRLRAEIERVIQEVEPTRPSTAVTQPVEVAHADGRMETLSPEIISQARGTQAHRLKRRLSGDLDNVILMALRKDPSRRYETAQQFGEDIHRHLGGLTVVARPDTMSYRVRKFVGRHRVGVSAASAIVLLLVGSTTGLAIQSAEIRATAREAALERDRAQLVSDFLMDVFRTSDPNTSRGETITARELLDRGAEQMEEELRDQPDLLAELSYTVSQVYNSLGLYETAATKARRALTLWKELHAPPHHNIARGLNNLGAILSEKGPHDEADSVLHVAVAMRRELFGSADTLFLNSLASLAYNREKAGEWDQAESLYREVLETRRSILGPRDPQVAKSLNNLGNLLTQRGRLDEAEQMHREALAIRREVRKSGHLEIATSANSLAAVLLQRRDFEGAASHFREALDLYRARLDKDHPNISIIQSNLAAALIGLRRYDEAEELRRSTLAIQRARLGDGHPYVAMGLSGVGYVLLRKRDYEGAETFFRDALELQQKLLGPEHPNTAVMESYLAETLYRKGSYGESERRYRSALPVFETKLGAGHVRTAEGLLGLGRVLLATNRAAEAEPVLRQAVEIRRAKYGDKDVMTAEAEGVLGVCLARTAHFQEAENLLVSARDVLSAAPFRNEEDLQEIEAELRRLYKEP